MPDRQETTRSDKGRQAVGRRWRLIAAAVLVTTFVVVAIGWWVLRPAEVQVIMVKTARVEIALSVVGRVRPKQLVDVRARNAGQIVQLLHDEGDMVAAGAATLRRFQSGYVYSYALVMLVGLAAGAAWMMR